MSELFSKIYTFIFGSIFDTNIELVHNNLGDFAIVPLDILKYMAVYLDKESLINIASTNREFKNLYSKQRM